jgi:Helix-turn-helix domain
MSIEAMAIALHHSRAKGTAKLVLLGIANHDGDGGAFPKIATLAKYANVHPRRVVDALNTLGELGEIIIHHKDGGTHRTPSHVRPNLYEIVLQCPEECDRTKNHRIDGERLGRSYKGQHEPDHAKDPERVERGREARARAQAAVDNATLPPSAKNSTSDESSTTPSAESSTTPSAENDTTKNHQEEPPQEHTFCKHLTTERCGCGKAAKARYQRAIMHELDAVNAYGITDQQADLNTKGAALARAVLRGEVLAASTQQPITQKAAVDDRRRSA